MQEIQNVIVFASGTKDGGGSGFKNLVRYSKGTGCGYRICAVVSNYKDGGVWKLAEELGIPFVHFPGPWNAEDYVRITEEHKAQWVVLSGWLKFVQGLDPRRTINIHPARLSFQNGRFGGPGLFGHHVHEAVREALEKGELDQTTTDRYGKTYTVAYSGFTMHFVTDRYDDPAATFAEVRVIIEKGMSAEQIQKAVNEAEHMWQPGLTNLVVTGKIRFEQGKVIVPLGYTIIP